MEVPWVEKYRPMRLRDVVGNEEAISRLRAISGSLFEEEEEEEEGLQHGERAAGNLPNLILSGPPGTGKTTSVHCLARELLGEEMARAGTAVLELNASDARGIDVVRNKIKLFAHKKVVLPTGRHKIVILDEADSMTQSAQQAMRRIMETYSSTTRFALACNNSSKIIEPLQSRCAIIRFSRLSDEEVLLRLREVCEREAVQSTADGLSTLIFTADGDMRNAINNLQSTVAGFGTVTKDNVLKVCDQPHPLIIQNMLKCCLEGDVVGGLERLRELWDAGYAATDIIGSTFKVCRRYDMPEDDKLECFREIGFSHMRIAEGLGTWAQLAGCVARLAQSHFSNCSSSNAAAAAAEGASASTNSSSLGSSGSANGSQSMEVVP